MLKAKSRHECRETLMWRRPLRLTFARLCRASATPRLRNRPLSWDFLEDLTYKTCQSIILNDFARLMWVPHKIETLWNICRSEVEWGANCVQCFRQFNFSEQLTYWSSLNGFSFRALGIVEHESVTGITILTVPAVKRSAIRPVFGLECLECFVGQLFMVSLSTCSCGHKKPSSEASRGRVLEIRFDVTFILMTLL